MSALTRSYKMDNITYFTDELTKVEFAIITHLDGSTTSMTKETYDAQQAAQVAPQA